MSKRPSFWKPPRRISYEMIVAVSAIVISLSALIVSVYETSITRKQQFASVWPYIFHAPSLNNGVFTYSIENVGMGPAMIKEARMEADGQDYVDPVEFIAAILKISRDSLEKTEYGYSTLPGSVIRAGDKKSAVWVNHPDLAEKIFLAQKRWRIEICYCSMYQDCWKTLAFAEAVPSEDCQYE